MAARRSPAAPTHGRAHASSGISKFFERRLEPSRQVLEKLGFELDDDQPRAGQTLQELDQAEDGDETIRYRRQS